VTGRLDSTATEVGREVTVAGAEEGMETWGEQGRNCGGSNGLHEAGGGQDGRKGRIGGKSELPLKKGRGSHGSGRLSLTSSCSCTASYCRGFLEGVSVPLLGGIDIHIKCLFIVPGKHRLAKVELFTIYMARKLINFPVNVATAPTKHLNPGSSLRLLLSMPPDSTQRIESGPVAETVYVEMPEGAGIFSSRLAATNTKNERGCTFCNVQSVSMACS